MGQYTLSVKYNDGDVRHFRIEPCEDGSVKLGETRQFECLDDLGTFFSTPRSIPSMTDKVPVHLVKPLHVNKGTNNVVFCLRNRISVSISVVAVFSLFTSHGCNYKKRYILCKEI